MDRSTLLQSERAQLEMLLNRESAARRLRLRPGERIAVTLQIVGEPTHDALEPSDDEWEWLLGDDRLCELDREILRTFRVHNNCLTGAQLPTRVTLDGVPVADLNAGQLVAINERLRRIGGSLRVLVVSGTPPRLDREHKPYHVVKLRGSRYPHADRMPLTAADWKLIESSGLPLPVVVLLRHFREANPLSGMTLAPFLDDPDLSQWASSRVLNRQLERAGLPLRIRGAPQSRRHNGDGVKTRYQLLRVRI